MATSTTAAVPMHTHQVQFYNDDHHLFNTLCSYLSPLFDESYEDGTSAVIIARPAPTRYLKDRFMTRGYKSEFGLEKGADIKATTTNGWTALHPAADNGHEAAVRLPLEKGADIKATVQDGSMALHLATRGYYKKVMRLLAEKEADIKTEGKDVQRALESN